jgi:prepilin-type processing-associated H-X9-DG protein
MKRIVCAIAALAAFVPLSAAHATAPFACQGSPEIPASYVCIVRARIGAGIVGTGPEQPVDVPSHDVTITVPTVTTPTVPVNVPGQPVHIPVVCVALGCVGPFDATTPPVNQTVPSETVVGFEKTFSTPPISQTIPGAPVLFPNGGEVVLWYQGTCYYLWLDGHASQVPSTTPDGCP